MKRFAVVLAIVGCQSEKPAPAPPPPAPVAVVVDAGSGSGSGSGSGAPAMPVYRTDASTDHVDKSITGHGKTFMVVSESPEASAVGRDVLAHGGTAIDAAIATAFVLAVVHPQAGNIGGGGFATIRDAKGGHATLDFRETAPAAAKVDMYTTPDSSMYGALSVGVPGSVAGLWALHEKYGKTPWKDLVAPAIARARDGFVVDKYLHEAITLNKHLPDYAASKALWFDAQGNALAVGATLRVPELAATLDRIADKGADGFYKGPTADAIVAEQKADGGVITAADLAAYKVAWRKPIEFTYRGYRLTSMPLPSSGGIALAMLANLLGDHITPDMVWHGADHLHRLVESLRRVYAARNLAMGDPAFAKDMPIDMLLSKAWAEAQAKTIDPMTASKSADVKPLVEGNHTTNLCVVDGSGMAIALTTTINFTMGSAVTVGGAGFLLNDEMDDFATHPGAANAYGLVMGEKNKVEPGKRMLSSMAPTIVEDAKGKLVIVVGAGRGGPRIITAVWQTISNMLDFKQGVAVAIAAPRIHHQHVPDTIKLEAESISADVEAELKKRGHSLTWGEPSRIFGAVNAIERVDGAGGGWDGAADPRGGGSAVGD